MPAIVIAVKVACGYCDTDGEDSNGLPCEECSGTGTINSVEDSIGNFKVGAVFPDWKD